MLNCKFCVTVASAALLLAVAVKAQDAAGPRLSLIDDPATEAQGLFVPWSAYWLGVVVSRPSPAMREELKLPKDQGLLIEHVQSNSPAEKAGIKDRDVLLRANDKPLSDIRDLLKMINEVKEGKLTLKLLRGGKHEAVVASLAKRPADMIPQPITPEAREWLRRFGAAVKDGQPLRFQVFGPGQIVPQGTVEATPSGVATTKVEVTVCTKASLPDGSQIEITRSGENPAKVVVTRDRDRWEGTSDDLSKIPEKVRPEVERLLQAPTDHIHFFADPLHGCPAAGPAQGNVIFFGGEPNVQKRLADMQKQIDELKQQVKALQGKSKKE